MSMLRTGVRRRVAAALAAGMLVAPAHAAPLQQAEEVPGIPTDKGYNFSRFWMKRNVKLWSRVMKSFVGRPNLRYLEIGLFEGQSVVWMLENVLTDPSCRVTGIDIFPEGLRRLYDHNIEASGAPEKVTTMVGYSQVQLRKLPLEHFDIIYIDGSHVGDDTLEDATLCHRLLKKGGLLIFDDYHFLPDVRHKVTTKMAIDTFIEFYGWRFRTLHVGEQVVLKKKQKIRGEDNSDGMTPEDIEAARRAEAEAEAKGEEGEESGS